MARKFLTHLDLAQNELQNARVQNLASAPSTPVKGQLYYNSTGGNDTLYWWDGTTWQSAKGSAFGTITAQTSFGMAKADGVASTAARSDHAHGTPTHAAADHTTFPINTFAAATGPINMNGSVINNVGNPVLAADGANKQYVDNLVAGLSWKDTVRLASTTNIATISGPQTIDGVSTTNGDRVLLKNQTTLPETNGIWIAAAGAWTRATDADTEAELLDAAVFVSEGSTQADTAWVCTTNAPIIVGTNALTWVQFGGGSATTTLTGDVTGTGAGTVPTTIANNAVTNAKAADMASGTIKARVSAGAGDPEDVTGVQLATLLVGQFTRKFTAAIGDGSATSYVVTHNLGAPSGVHVQVYRVASPFDLVDCDVENTSINTVTVRFATAPTTSQYNVTVVG